MTSTTTPGYTSFALTLLASLVLGGCAFTASDTGHQGDSGTDADANDDSELPTALSRLAELNSRLDQPDPHHRVAQTMASVEAELGRYRQAEHRFPWPDQRIPVDLPSPESHRAVDAVDGIVTLARDRQLVMINETHHLPRHRTLTSALLPRLRALGFTHFAAEALDPSDHELGKRGYVRNDSSSTYLREPLYGDLVRQALALGFVVVPYEDDSSDPESREAGQARNLHEAVFAKNPEARLIVHAGYAHIDEAPSRRLWHVEPLAMRLRTLTGIDPLTVEQTLFPATRSVDAKPPEIVDLATRFGLTRASILLESSDNSAWRIHPELHDVSVIWPSDTGSNDQRPGWLAMNGERSPWPVSPAVCNERLPCVVEATLSDEPANAVAIDRYAFFSATDPEVPLWLPAGRYRLVASDEQGQVLDEERITIDRRR